MTPVLYKSGPGRELGEGYRFLGLGLQFAGGIIFFAVGGVFLDGNAYRPYQLIGESNDLKAEIIRLYERKQPTKRGG